MRRKQWWQKEGGWGSMWGRGSRGPAECIRRPFCGATRAPWSGEASPALSRLAFLQGAAGQNDFPKAKCSARESRTTATSLLRRWPGTRGAPPAGRGKSAVPSVWRVGRCMRHTEQQVGRCTLLKVRRSRRPPPRPEFGRRRTRAAVPAAAGRARCCAGPPIPWVGRALGRAHDDALARSACPPLRLPRSWPRRRSLRAGLRA